MASMPPWRSTDTGNGARREGRHAPRHALALSRDALAAAGILVLSAVSAYFLGRFTPAAWPLVDSMVTWSSVFATFLVARKVYENWHWWLVIDAVSLCLYFSRQALYLTVLLFALYLVLIVIGMRQWRRSLPLRRPMRPDEVGRPRAATCRARAGLKSSGSAAGSSTKPTGCCATAGAMPCACRRRSASGASVARRTHVPIGVDREWEGRVLEGAVAADLAPAPEHCDPRRGVLISRWEAGRG